MVIIVKKPKNKFDRRQRVAAKIGSILRQCRKFGEKQCEDIAACEDCWSCKRPQSNFHDGQQEGLQVQAPIKMSSLGLKSDLSVRCAFGTNTRVLTGETIMHTVQGRRGYRLTVTLDVACSCE